MNALELQHLKNFCNKHRIDFQEIDDSITYSANLDRLKEFVPTELDELEVYAKTYEDQEKATMLGERYGLGSENMATFEEVGQIRVKAIIQYWYRHEKTIVKATRKITEIIRGYINKCLICPYSNGCTQKVKVDVQRKIIRIYGTTTALTIVLAQLEVHQIRFKTLKIRMDTRRLEWISGHGWVRKP